MTNGHLDICTRASTLFDEVIMAVGTHPRKRGYLTAQERVELIGQSVEHLPNVRAASFGGLVVNFCRTQGASVIIRGLRATSDFEPEFRMALANRDLNASIETVFMVPSVENLFVSSSLVREIASHRGSFVPYVPPPVAAAISRRIQLELETLAPVTLDDVKIDGP
jgi:pantetheine-phosphate adenylyltransferase